MINEGKGLPLAKIFFYQKNFRNSFLYRKSEKTEEVDEGDLRIWWGIWDPTTLLAKRDLDKLPIVNFYIPIQSSSSCIILGIIEFFYSYNIACILINC